MHAVRLGEEVAAVLRQRRGARTDVSQYGVLDAVGVRGLADLGELLRVTEEQDALRREGARNRVW